MKNHFFPWGKHFFPWKNHFFPWKSHLFTPIWDGFAFCLEFCGGCLLFGCWSGLEFCCGWGCDCLALAAAFCAVVWGPAGRLAVTGAATCLACSTSRVSDFIFTNSRATSSVFRWARMRRIVHPVSLSWSRLVRAHHPEKVLWSMMSLSWSTAIPTRGSRRPMQ